MRDRFSMYHPVCGFLFFIVAAVVSMVLFHPLFLSVSFLCALTYLLVLRGRKAFGLLLKFLLPMAVVVTLINALLNSYGTTVLFALPWGLPFTAEALLFGFCQALLFSSVLLWLFCYSDVMGSEKFLFVFGRIFPNTALLFSMTLRFIPLFVRRAGEIRMARRARSMENPISSTAGVLPSTGLASARKRKTRNSSNACGPSTETSLAELSFRRTAKYMDDVTLRC